MPILSIRRVRRPRRQPRYCDECRTPIPGALLQIYGMPDYGDPPWTIELCASCAEKSHDPQVTATHGDTA